MNNDEDLTDLGRAGLKVIQKRAGYRFGMDSVLLADFARVKPGYNVADLCSGCGIVPLLMLGRYPKTRYTGIEIQARLVEMAKQSIRMNGLEDSMGIIHGDIRNMNIAKLGKHDAVTANPPYLPAFAGANNPKEEIALARHEITCSINDVCAAAFRLLKTGGVFYMVHRTERLTDVLCALRENRTEPKILRFIHSFKESPPNLFLVKAKKDASSGMDIRPPLVVYKDQGVFTDEVSEIYNGG